jgi:hypothetical protein
MLTEANQEKVVEARGLGSLLNLLRSSEDEIIRQVATGTVANLAMNCKVPLFAHEDRSPSPCAYIKFSSWWKMDQIG